MWSITIHSLHVHVPIWKSFKMRLLYLHSPPPRQHRPGTTLWVWKNLPWTSPFNFLLSCLEALTPSLPSPQSLTFPHNGQCFWLSPPFMPLLILQTSFRSPLNLWCSGENNPSFSHLLYTLLKDSKYHQSPHSHFAATIRKKVQDPDLQVQQQFLIGNHYSLEPCRTTLTTILSPLFTTMVARCTLACNITVWFT